MDKNDADDGGVSVSARPRKMLKERCVKSCKNQPPAPSTRGTVLGYVRLLLLLLLLTWADTFALASANGKFDGISANRSITQSQKLVIY